MATASTPVPDVRKTQRTFFDLDSFEDVLCAKSYQTRKATSVSHAAELLNNNQVKLLEIINRGLAAEDNNQHYNDLGGWYVVDDSGNVTDSLFAGKMADQKAVNALVLTLAKTVFGYDSNEPIEKRREAKESAKNMIRGSEQIRAGLAKSAAVQPEEIS
ncbi:MAG: hypothetical protein ACREHG_00040 [Candidatus Saccharimonadales bacterium]